MAGRIWKALHAEPQTPAQRVLSRCRQDTVDCWRSDNYNVKLALFLQSHGSDGNPAPAGAGKVCIAYESYHPAPLQFTRELRIAGGSLAEHDPDEVLELAAGRNRGRNYRSAVLPQWVAVKRDAGGVAKIDADIGVVGGSPALDAEPFSLSVTFPEKDPMQCSCC
jgi:hypothetical protein